MAKRSPRNTQQRELSFFNDPVPPPPVAASNSKESAVEMSAVEVPIAPPTRETVFILDAHSLIYQVFHAVPNMTSPAGQPVGAVHGFIRDIVDILQNRQPTYLICAFDAPGDNFRHTLFPEYKIHREAMPEELRPQIKQIQQMLAALAIPVLQLPGYEADDVLATVAHAAEELGRDCYVVTADKDCRQLITEHVKILNIRKNEIYDAAALQVTWGIRPDQVVDFQSLVGDPVDNVPGVPLIGPKMAQELLQKYDTLEGLYARLDELNNGKRKDNLKQHEATAYLSRQLVRLDPHVPMTIDWNAARVGGIDREAVQSLCREFGFRQLAERLGGLSVRSAPSHWEANYQTVDSLERLRELCDRMQQQSHVVIDTETTSVQPRWAEIVGISFCFQPGEAYYVPIRAPAGENVLPWESVREVLQPLLVNPGLAKVGQNLKYDCIVLRTHGVAMQGITFDTMVADYLLDPGERSHNLDDLAKRYLNHDNITIESLIGSGKNQKCMDQVPVALITPYAAEDADVPLRLLHILQPRLEEEGLAPLFHDLEMPLIEVLAELEFNGICIDPQQLATLSSRLEKRMLELEAEIYAIAGSTFNINSPKQLADVLFVKLNLPIIKKTQTGASTDVEVLEELAKQHELPAKIIEYRQNSKLKSGFVDALPQLIHPQTRRVHTSFKQDVAATGRLSSSDPNLQNIPIRTELGREIRAAFQPGHADWLFLSADYSQIELRVLAHFSEDAELLEAFANDHDIHTLVAAQVYGVEESEVTKEMRRSAKAINFGVIYGQSAFGLAKSLSIPQDEAQRFIDAYFAKYQGVERFMETTLDECRQRGYVSTISGRRRPVQGVRDRSARGDKRQRLLPERIAINSVIQGSAADIIKLAMIRLHRRLQQESWQAKMLLQIHDELLFEAPPAEMPQLQDLVLHEMSQVMPLRVPLRVDAKTGKNWAECE
jgi:DNA polymerase I